MLRWNILQYLTKMMRQYFSGNERLDMFLTCFCNILCYVWIPRKKRVSERVLQRVVHRYNLIRDSGDTLGEREKSCQESGRDSRWSFWRDSWREYSRSPRVSPESWIGLYAWLSARLSPRLVFLRGIADLRMRNIFSLHMHAIPSFSHRSQTTKMASYRTNAQNNSPSV